MNSPKVKSSSQFDEFAEAYEKSLDKGLRISGESKDFFAQHRVEWLARRLLSLTVSPQNLLDFGCGTGSSTRWLCQLPGARSLVGVEISEASLEIARRDHQGFPQAQFQSLEVSLPIESIDLAFCNGVFHHIPPPERAKSVDLIWKSLRPGGHFAFWENNPWNPGTLYIMSRIPFDRDAITLTPPESRRLLQSRGFRILHTDYRFFFPRSLAWFRAIEYYLTKIPLGAQYLILAQKPFSS